MGVIGATPDIPYLLRSICVFAPFLNANSHLKYSNEMRQLLTQPPEETDSVYLRPAPAYLKEWWGEYNPAAESLTSQDLRAAIGHHFPLVSPNFPSGRLQTLRSAKNEPRRSFFDEQKPLPESQSERCEDGHERECNKCHHYRKIAQTASEVLRESSLHISAMKQFVEWSAAASQRMCLGFKFLTNKSDLLKRDITVDDLLSFSVKDFPDTTDGSEFERQSTRYPIIDGLKLVSSVSPESKLDLLSDPAVLTPWPERRWPCGSRCDCRFADSIVYGPPNRR